MTDCVGQLGMALWDLKRMYDQHGYNKHLIKELESFIQEVYSQYIPDLVRRFKEGGGNSTGADVLNQLQRDLVEATNNLQKWSTSKCFPRILFRVLNSGDRMKELQKLHTKVLDSVQKSFRIATLSAVLDMRDSQDTILKLHEEWQSRLTMSSQIEEHSSQPSPPNPSEIASLSEEMERILSKQSTGVVLAAIKVEVTNTVKVETMKTMKEESTKVVRRGISKKFHFKNSEECVVWSVNRGLQLLSGTLSFVHNAQPSDRVVVLL